MTRTITVVNFPASGVNADRKILKARLIYKNMELVKFLLSLASLL